MSKEIKMSDVWNNLPNYGVYDNATVNGMQLPNGLYGILFSCEEPAMAVIHAINNHDRLVEENKRLRDMLKRLVSHDNCKKDVIHLMSEADSLLSELDGE